MKQGTYQSGVQAFIDSLTIVERHYICRAFNHMHRAGHLWKNTLFDDVAILMDERKNWFARRGKKNV